MVILVLTLIPGEAVPEVDIVNFDKLVHFFIFGVLMITTSYGLLKVSMVKNFPGKPILIAAIYSVAFGVCIEFIQRLIPGRSFSLYDMIANTIGVVIGYLLFQFLKKSVLIRD